MEYKTSLSSLAKFELKSLMGRLVFSPRPKLDQEKAYLNLGCGENYIQGMVNADFYSGFRFWNKKRKLEWYLDLRYPLRCDDAKFDGVFTEHTLEHLYPDQALGLLVELNRIMKTGAVLRLTVPDLEKYVNFYNGALPQELRVEFSKRFKTRASAIRNMSQNFFHLSLWDFEELSMYLSNAGFVDITRKEYRDCSDPMLCHDLEARRWETVYVEAKKA